MRGFGSCRVLLPVIVLVLAFGANSFGEHHAKEAKQLPSVTQGRLLQGTHSDHGCNLGWVWAIHPKKPKK